MIEKRLLGQSGISVSKIALGTMYFGWKDSRVSSVERLNQYAEAGGNFIDTANVYTRREAEGLDLYGKDFDKFEDGASEKLIGEWMREKKNRSEIVLATKVGFAYPGIKIGTSRKQIIEECEKSLKRLKTDYIDVYYLHMDDKSTPLEESLGALTELVKDGRVRSVGLSNFTAERLLEAVCVAKREGFALPSCIQNKGTYLKPRADVDYGRQAPLDDSVISLAKELGITPVAYSPLAKGYYAKREKGLAECYRSAENEEKIKLLDKTAREIGVTPVQLVYAYLIQNDPSIIPVAASSTREQFCEVIGALDISLSDDFIKSL